LRILLFYIKLLRTRNLKGVKGVAEAKHHHLP
jgi:hypothetical protein